MRHNSINNKRMDKIEQLDRILIDYNLGNIRRHKAREKICLLFDVVERSEQLVCVCGKHKD